MEPKPVAALADDLTGALEVGAKFAGRGMAAEVAVWPRIEAGGAAAVIDIETRHIEPDEAAARVLRAAPAAELIFHKTDSTLRGNIAAEIAALARAYPQRRVLYVPAYPSMGRTVRGGRLFVEGVPLEETAFARDPRRPARGSDVRQVLGIGAGVEIVDAETEDGVARAAGRILTAPARWIACGTGALAGHLAAGMGARTEPPRPGVARAVVVNGSMHEQSRRQVRAAREAWAEDSGWTILESPDETAAAWRPAQLAAEAKVAIEALKPQAVIVFGGETALELVREMGWEKLEPVGEVLPGMPLTRCGGLWMVTKAGGFGAVDTLEQMRRRLQG